MVAYRGEARQFYDALELGHDECILWPFGLSRTGYGFMRINGEHGEVHRFVCRRFHGKRPAGKQVAHSCGVRRCVNPEHLRWATPKQNTADKTEHGTQTYGQRHPRAKLTTAQVIEIRELKRQGVRHRAIADQFGVAESTISRIVNNKKWRDLFYCPVS